ncbi:MAG: proteasome accessory factor PafA2 family protein [Patescibacteria group bacterium]
MKDTILGVETEYGLYFKKDGKPAHLLDKEIIMVKFNNLLNEYLKNDNQCDIGPSFQFLENGGRLYIDTNIHPEYATPECSSAIEIVKYNKAGHNIFFKCKKPLEEKFKNEGYDIALTFLADNKALNPDRSNNNEIYNTYGTHENYCIQKSSYNYDLWNWLLPFLATRQIYSGAGAFFTEKNNKKYPYGFVLSPRAFFTEETVGGATTAARPMINTRDEPHANKESLWRLHILCGESNRSDWSNWLKIGVTALVISTFCKKPSVFKNKPNLANPLSTFKTVSKDCDPNKKNVLCFNEETSEHFYLSALKIQKIYLEKAREYAAGEKSDNEAEQIINEWAEILAMLERKDEELEYMLDWKIKQKLFREMEQRKKAKNENFTNWDRANIDIKYHNIDPGGIFEIMEKAGHIKRLVSDADVLEALIYPPSTTRALARGIAIKICKQLGLYRKAVDWTSISINGEQFSILNPFLPNQSDASILTENSSRMEIFAAHYPELNKFLKRTAVEILGNKPRVE